MNNDLISREALKKAIKKSVPYVEQERILDLIDNAPSVAQSCKKLQEVASERPQGEWTIGYTAKQKKVAVCNLCNCISFQGKTNFCHNCGAKMQKGGVENE